MKDEEGEGEGISYKKLSLLLSEMTAMSIKLAGQARPNPFCISVSRERERFLSRDFIALGSGWDNF